MAQPSVDSLPKWARERIQGLERDLDRANTKLLTIAGEFKSNTNWQQFYGETPINIPDDATVEFRVPLYPHDRYAHFHVRHPYNSRTGKRDLDRIEVSATTPLTLRPGATNILVVELERRD